MDLRKKIRSVIKGALDEFGIRCRDILLFGSRARNDNRADSDFDILVVTDEDVPRDRVSNVSAVIRERLAQTYLDAGMCSGTDLIIKSAAAVAEYRTKTGSLVRNAMNECVVL